MVACKGELTAEAVEPVYEMMKSTILEYVMDTTETNPECDFVAEGKGEPIASRQRILREVKFVDLLFTAITIPFDKAGSLNLLSRVKTDPRYRHLKKVVRLQLRLMTCCFAGNRRNEDYVAGKKMQDTFLGLLGEDLAVAACVTSLFSNNKHLLDEEVSLGTINLFVDLIRRKVSRPLMLQLSSYSAMRARARRVVERRLPLHQFDCYYYSSITNRLA